MDLEKNVLDIVNEEGHFDLDEENDLSQGHESFQEGEERFSIDEINIKNPISTPENIISCTKSLLKIDSFGEIGGFFKTSSSAPSKESAKS